MYMKNIFKLFSKCNHNSWKYVEERIYQSNEIDSKNRWGSVHDVISWAFLILKY